MGGYAPKWAKKAGLCNHRKKHEKIPLNPINQKNITCSFRFLIA